MILFNPDESPSIPTDGQVLRRSAGVVICGGLTPLLAIEHRYRRWGAVPPADPPTGYRASLPPLGDGTPGGPPAASTKK